MRLGVEKLIEKPIDVPAFLKMIRERLAETTEAKLKRLCGNDAYCRYIGGHDEPYLRMLQQRYAAPFRMPTCRKVQSNEESDVDTELPTAIPEPAGIHERQAESGRTRTLSIQSERPHKTHEDDSIERER